MEPQNGNDITKTSSHNYLVLIILLKDLKNITEFVLGGGGRGGGGGE